MLLGSWGGGVGNVFVGGSDGITGGGMGGGLRSPDCALLAPTFLSASSGFVQRGPVSSVYKAMIASAAALSFMHTSPQAMRAGQPFSQ